MAVSRQSQIDSVELDAECSQLFQSQLNQSLSHLPINVFKKIEPEISALLDLAVYVVPLYTNSSLLSHELLGIGFSKNPTQGNKRKWYIYGFLVVGIKWISQRWSTISTRFLNDSTSIEPFSQVLNYCNISTKIISIINNLVFLKQGLYPTLLHRVLNLQTYLVNSDESKSADLTTLTRELLWHSFAEILMFALPLVNIHKVKSWLFQLKLRDDNQPTVVKNSLCAVCNEAPTLPQETNCHHIFCYYCLKANLEAVSDYRCPLCSSYVFDEFANKI